MADDFRVQRIAEQILDSEQTPEDACRGDTELLSAVQNRLKQFRALNDHLDVLFPTGAAASPSTASKHETVANRAWSIQSLGDYRILREIGRGGMGIVYEAVQESLGRRVALKILARNSPGNGVPLERFRREARSAARLHHTSIVPVFDVGEFDGTHFYAMQYIEGRGLNQVLADLRRKRTDPSLNGAATRAGPLDYRKVARIGAIVAEALAYAHVQEILHRDIKPANILLADDGGVWICDFGLAKTDDEDLTLTGDLVGTLRYMAPERLSGITDARSDLYSLGLTLYEMLTLKPAFDECDRGRLIQQITVLDPIPPSQIDRRIARDLETIVLKAIAKEPRNRYPSATALAEDLERFLGGLPILARPASWWERGWKCAKRRPAAAAALAVSLLALSAIVGMAVEFTVRLKTERDLAQVQKERAESSYRLARDAIDRGLPKVRDDPQLQRGDLEGIKRKLGQIETDFYEQFVQLQGDDPTFQAQRADAFLRLGHAAVEFGGRSADAIVNYRHAVEIDRRLVASDGESLRHKKHLADGLYALGCQLRFTCQHEAALADLREAEAICDELRTNDPKNTSFMELFANILDERGNCETLIGDLSNAEATLLRAEPVLLALVDQFPQNSELNWRLTKHRVLTAEARQGPDGFRRAETDLLQAISSAEKLLAENPDDAQNRHMLTRALADLAYVYQRTSRFNRSLETLQRSDPVCEKLVLEHPTAMYYLHGWASCRKQIAMCYAGLKNYDMTVQWFRMGIELYDRLILQNPNVVGLSSDFGDLYAEFGAALNSFGKVKEAIPPLDQAVSLLEQAYQFDPRSVRHLNRLVRARWDRGYARLSLGQFAEARPDYDRAVELSPTNSAPRLYWQRADVLARLGDHGAAFAEIERTSAGRNLAGDQYVYLARIVRQCVQALGNDKSLAQSEIDALTERYAARAVEWLARAKAIGHFDDGARMQALLVDPDFEPLTSRDDFRKLFPR